MSNPEIGIIGGTGGIGKWFADLFQKEGFNVHVSGRKTGMRVVEMAGRCAIVIVSVPISATEAVIREVGPHLPPASLFMDLTSLKSTPVKAMLESSPCEVIGLHPLFGPDVASLSDQNVVVCPARGRKWLPWLQDLLSACGALLIETSPEKHDEIMAVVQGLTHLNTMTMGLVLRETGLSSDVLDSFSTPIFRAKLAFIEKVFQKNPRLYAEILTSNPHMSKILAYYERVLNRLREPVVKGDSEALEKLLKS